MGDAVGVILVVAFGLVLLALGVLGHLMAARRRRELQQLADELGLTFSPGRDGRMEERFAAFGCLRQGSRRYAENVLRGRLNGRAVCGFDYHYETYSRDSRGRRRTHHHWFSAVVVDSGLPLKPLFIRPEGFLDRVAEFVGWDDIDFELDAFSRRFYVKAPDRKWAFDVIHQATMEFLMNSPAFHIEFAGPHVMAWRPSRLEPGEFREAMSVLEGILERLPEYLLRELKGEQSS